MRFKELKSVRGFLTAVTLVAVCGAAGAGYADYVTLEKSGDSSGDAWKADKLMYTEGVNYHWSDGLAPTDPEKDYLVKCCLASFTGEFKGGSLTLAEKAYLRPRDSGECKIADLRTEGGSAINSQLATMSIYFSGCLTLLDSTGTTPFSIIGGKSGQSTYIAMDIKGGENTVMETGACKYMNADGSSQHVGGPMATVFSGQNDGFLGIVRVITNMVLKLSTSLPNATVEVAAPDAVLKGVDVSSGVLEVGKLNVSSGTFELEPSVAKWDVRTLSFGDGAKIAINADSALERSIIVADSVEVEGIVEIDPSSCAGVRRVRLLAVPGTADGFPVSSFRLCTSPYRYTTECVNENGTNYLDVVDAYYGNYSAEPDFVTVDVQALVENEAKPLAERSNIFADGGLWSDGNLPQNPEKDYYLGGGSTARADGNIVFAGRSLVIGCDDEGVATTVVDIGKGADGFVCDELVFADGAYHYCNGTRARLSGRRLTVTSRASRPAKFMFNAVEPLGSVSRLTYDFADMRGWSDAVISLYANGKGDTFIARGLKGEVVFAGGHTNYLGTVEASEAVRVVLGGTGMPYGRVRLTHADTAVISAGADGAVVPLSVLETTSGGAKVTVDATNEMSIASVVLAGALEKTGSGTLRTGKVSGTDAKIVVAAGGLRGTAPDAFSTTEIELAEGAFLVRNFADTALEDTGMQLGTSPSGSLNMRVEELPEGPGKWTVALATLPEAEAEAFAENVSLAAVKRATVKVVCKDAADGCKTVCAEYVRGGLVFSVR